MNSVTSITTTRQPEFVAVLLDKEIRPYALGVLDAERGDMACPEQYYMQRWQMCEYCAGYAAVAGATLTTEQFLGKVATAQRKFNAMCAAMMGEDDDEVEAVIDEVFGKPGLGTEDSAGLFDDATAAAYAQGQEDYAAGIYWPGSVDAPAFDAYIAGWNDSYAATQPAVKLSR